MIEVKEAATEDSLGVDLQYEYLVLPQEKREKEVKLGERTKADHQKANAKSHCLIMLLLQLRD